MSDYTFSCDYKAGETVRLPQFHFPHTILSVRSSRGRDGWTHIEVLFQADVSPEIFRGMTAIEVFKITAPPSAVPMIRKSCLTVGEPMKGQRAKPGTVPYRRPDQLMRSPNLRRQY